MLLVPAPQLTLRVRGLVLIVTGVVTIMKPITPAHAMILHHRAVVVLMVTIVIIYRFAQT